MSKISLILILTTFVIYNEAQRYFVTGPNVFRLNVEETVSVQVWQPTKVEVYLQDANKKQVFSKVTKDMLARKPEIFKLRVTEKDLPAAFSRGKLHYFLVAKGKGFQKETPVLLDLRGGTVFIQTDKPIYTPKNLVRYRVVPVGLDLRPLKQKVMVEIINPQGIRVRRQRDIQAWKRGFESMDFPLGDLPATGTWSITAYFGHKNMENSTTTFVVKEYVLPTFLVRIHPPTYVSRKDEKFMVKVIAKHSYGKNVRGMIRLKVNVMGEEKEVEVHEETSLIDGEIAFSLDADKLVESKTSPSFPIGKKLKIIAVVTERATGIKQQATDASVYLVKSPYTIDFEGTIKYFTPSVSFRVQVNVRYPNKIPARNVALRVEASNGGTPLGMADDSNIIANTDEDGKAFFTLNMPQNVNDATRINIKVSTTNTNVEKAEKTLILEPYRTAKKNYIILRPPRSVLKVGSSQSIKALIPFVNGIDQLTYMVIARGKIVAQGIVRNLVGVETSFTLTITAEMAPKCRILVYYERNGEVAADSVLVDVEDVFANQITLKTNSKSLRPADNLQLELITQKNSLIGLIGVDQSVYYLRNKSRVTREKIFKDIGGFDLGCGPGSGKNNQDVFYNAGLAAMSNLAFSTTRREELTCPDESRKRRRRSIGKKSVQVSLIEKCCKGRCCTNFYKTRLRISLNAKCKDLQPRILSSCWEDFYSCCRRFEVFGRKVDFEDVVDADLIVEDEAEVTARQYFPEAWIWAEKKTEDDEKIAMGFTVPDSITTWEIAALSINDKYGLGFSNTIALPSTLNVFIHIKMPYSVKRYEQITIYAVVYNYNNRKTRANLYMKGHSSFCSIAKPGQRSPRISVVINKNDAVAIPFTIIPMNVGKIPIEFLVFTMDGGDQIVKELLVVPEGVQRRKTESILLDPRGIMQDKKKKKSVVEVRNKERQVNTLELKIPEDFVKGSQLVMVYVTGNLMGAAVQDIINGGLTKLIQLPTGCGEQTMIRMAPVVYVLRYLYTLKNAVTPEIETKAYNFIRRGYNHELKWRRTDNSYSVWGQRTPASTWLTAFVNKVFCQARQYIKDDIDDVIICESLVFLESIQSADGSFPEGYAVRHREMIGGVKSKVSLTAFVLISLMECKATCVNADSVVIAKANTFLESQITSIKSGYLMSLVTYALSVANSGRRMEAFNKLIGMLTSQKSKGRDVLYMRETGPALTIEATSYTLLSMVKLNQLDSAGPLVIWLTEQRNAKGAFYSTQDTVVALQALSEYSSKTAGGELDLSITVTAEKDKNIKETFKILPNDALVRKQADITNALPGRIYIDSTGKGTGQLQIETVYNRPATQDELCGYEIEVKTRESVDNKLADSVDGVAVKKQHRKKGKKRCRKKGKKGKKRRKNKKKCKKTKKSQQKDQVPNKLTIEICAKHKFANGSSMTMVEAGLLTGFTPDESSLKTLLSKDRDPRIDRYEITDRAVVFYLGKISHVKKTCFSFIAQKNMSVGDIQSVPVKVYDYYEPEDTCTTFYGPKGNSALLGTICGDDDSEECQCTQGKCPDEPTMNTRTLKKKACLNLDLVFIGVVGEIKDLNAQQRIAFKVDTIYKKGGKGIDKGSKIHVYKAKHCAYPLLKMNKKYIVMLKDDIRYLLDDTAFVMAWPSDDSRMKKLRSALDEVKQGNVCDEFILPL